ncbi:MAG: YbaN family protein [Clostridia bacterium]|nr:YbaN family protein [Clostridia bacterium]
MKITLIIAGTTFVALGILGIFLPLLPTTPFLLLGSACYIRSSKWLYNMLVNNKILGFYIKSYHEKKGIPLKAKVLSILLLWCSILYSIMFVITLLWVKVILLLIAISVSVHIVLIKTLNQENTAIQDDSKVNNLD